MGCTPFAMGDPVPRTLGMYLRGAAPKLAWSSNPTAKPDMISKMLTAVAGLLLAAGAAKAESAWPGEGTTWVLLVIGLVAIGIYAVSRMHRD